MAICLLTPFSDSLSNYDVLSHFLKFFGTNLHSGKCFNLFPINFIFIFKNEQVSTVRELQALALFTFHGHLMKVMWPDQASDLNLLQPLSQSMVK